LKLFSAQDSRFPSPKKLLQLAAMSKETGTQQLWIAQGRRVARKVNFAWWMQGFSAPLLLTGLLGTAAILLMRRHDALRPLWHYGSALAAVLVIAALVTWWLMRRRFESPEQALVRIEASMRLRSALSAAQAGVAPWPALPAEIHAGLGWHWQRVVLAPLAALLLLTASFLIPIQKANASQQVPDEPQAWASTEAELNKLEEEKIVDEEYIEEVRKKIEDLRAEDPQDWFSHSSLEATDNMRKEHKTEKQKLERAMNQAAKALETLQKNPQMSELEKARLANEFDQAVESMKNGAMKPNPGLMEKLNGLNPEKLGQLTPEQMQQLKQNMQQNAEKLQSPGEGEGEGEGEDWTDELLADGTHPSDKQGQGNGQGEGEGQEGGDKPGKGGVSRGPGHDPNLLGKASKELNTGKDQALQSRDLSKALPGDLLELQDGKHDIDTSASKVSGGGDVSDTGKGGDRVWKESLDPNEQKALKKFFD
jgi:hypothetical protein